MLPRWSFGLRENPSRTSPCVPLSVILFAVVIPGGMVTLYETASAALVHPQTVFHPDPPFSTMEHCAPGIEGRQH